MRKSLSILLAITLVFSMFSSLAFAAEPELTAQQKYDALAAKGIFAGMEDGSAGLDQPMDRAQFARVAALILGLDGIASEEAGGDTKVVTVKPFSDVELGLWYTEEIAAVKEASIFVGNGDGTFNPSGDITVQELAVVVAGLLGLTEVEGAAVEGAAAWSAGYVQAIINAGISFPTNYTESALRADLASLAFAADAAINTPVVVALAVASVTATNAKEVVVTYNKAVDETEGKKVANYAVTLADDTDLVVSAVSLSDDMKTATLTLTTALVNYSTNNKITVKKAVGLAADYEGTVGVADATIPSLLSVQATGPRELTLTFSEPVLGAANTEFKLDNGTVALGTITAAGTKLTLATLADLTEGSHSLELIANSLVKDYVGLVVKPGAYGFNYAKDITVPTVTVKESSEYTVTLKFSKNVNNVLTAPVLFSHTYDGQNQVLGSAAVTGSGDEYVVTFVNALAPGTSNVYIGYATATTDANKIKDNYGNVLAPVTLQVTTTVDATLPVAEKVEFKTSTTAEVTFSEKVTTATANDKANYTLKDSDAKTVVISSAVLDATGKIVTLTFTAINGGNFTLTVKNVKDISIAANKVTDTTLVFVASDKVNPTITDSDTGTVGVQAQKVATKKYIVKFSEAMDVASLTNKANYQVAGVALASGDTITATDSNKSALITFVTDPGAVTLTVGRIADVAGNTIVAFSTAVLLPATVSNPLFTKAEVLTKNTVKLYFAEVITGAVANDFLVDPGTNAFEAVTGIAITVVDSKTEITLTIASNISAALAQTLDVEVKVDGTVDAKNAYGAAVVLAATPAADKMASAIITNGVSTLDVNGNGKVDHIKVVFDENMFAGSISMDKFTVTGYIVQDAYASSTAPTAAAARTGATIVSDTDVYIQVKELDVADTAATPNVSFAAGITDVAGNAFAAVADKVTVDTAGPAVISVVIGDGVSFNAAADTLTITFSEAINTNFAVATAPTAAELDALFTFSAGAFAGTTYTVTDRSATAGTTLVLTAVGAPTVAIAAAATMDTNAAPTANDIEDVVNNNLIAAAVQATITVE